MTDGNEYPVDKTGEEQIKEELSSVITPGELTPGDESPVVGNDLFNEETTKAKKPFSWRIIRFLSFFFLGWNGLQLVFLPALAFIILDNETFFTFLTSLFSESSGFMPLALFMFLSYLVILFIMHLLSEMEYRARLNDHTIRWRNVPYLLINYGIPLFVQFVTVLLIQAAIFFIVFYMYQAISIKFHIHTDVFEVIYRFAVIFITFPWIIMQFMTDTTLEKGVKGRSFSYCYRRAKNLFSLKTGDIFKYLLIRLSFIMISLVFFKILIYIVILPFKIFLYYNFNVKTNIIFYNMLNTSDVLINISHLIIGLTIMGILYSPIATPLYWLNTKLIDKYLNRTGNTN